MKLFSGQVVGTCTEGMIPDSREYVAFFSCNHLSGSTPWQHQVGQARMPVRRLEGRLTTLRPLPFPRRYGGSQIANARLGAVQRPCCRSLRIAEHSPVGGEGRSV